MSALFYGSMESVGTNAAIQRFAVSAITPATTLVAAVSGKKHRILSYFVKLNAVAGQLKFQSFGSTGTDLTKTLFCAAKENFGQDFSPAGHLDGVSGEALRVLVTSTTASIHGTYQSL